MKLEWVVNLDRLGKYENQLQLCFPPKDTVMVYRLHTRSHSRHYKYMLLLPNLKRIIIDTEKCSFGTYQIEKIVKDSDSSREVATKIISVYVLEQL